MANRDQRRAKFTTAAHPPPGSKRAEVAQAEAKRVARGRANRIVTAVLAGVLLLLVGIGGYRYFGSDSQTANGSPASAPPAAPAADLMVRDDSHRLSEPNDSQVTFVEFLDFECEACGAAFPVVEELRKSYGDRVTFVARYFPLDSHFNAKRAARAVEAAAQQGQFEAMYTKMFTTQGEWGEQQVPQDALFRQFAVELGLDMAKWDAAYVAEATSARIQRDIDDGTELGIEGTPAFFLNGEKLEPQSVDDLRTALDEALAR